jgi:L-threonylcarbamoyladenylate synthase
MRQTIPFSKSSALSAAISLVQGRLVAFPTETVYGLGADASNRQAVGRIYQIKERPRSHPLIVHISNTNLLKYWVIEIPDYAQQIAEQFWPGPVTLILKKNPMISDFVTGGQSNIGIRIPNNSCALEILRNFEAIGGTGVAAPSANMFKSISPTNAQDVWKELGGRFTNGDLIIDGGNSKIGIESTIIDCTKLHPKILRPGYITQTMLENCVNMKLKKFTQKNKINHSGEHLIHYQPKTPLFVNIEPLPGDGLIALSEIDTPQSVYRLSTPKTLDSFASSLYSSFRKADEMKLARIVVILEHQDGIAEAIMDRATKASTRMLN